MRSSIVLLQTLLLSILFSHVRGDYAINLTFTRFMDPKGFAINGGMNFVGFFGFGCGGEFYSSAKFTHAG